MQETFEQHLRRFPFYPLRALIRRKRMKMVERMAEHELDLSERYEEARSPSNRKTVTEGDWRSPIDKGS